MINCEWGLRWMEGEMLGLYFSRSPAGIIVGRWSQLSQGAVPFWDLNYLTAAAFSWFVDLPKCQTIVWFSKCSARKEGRVSVCETHPRKWQPSQGQLIWDRDYFTCTWSQTIPDRTHCPHAAQVPEKQHQSLAPWPCAGTLKPRLMDTWHPTTFFDPLRLRDGVNFSSSSLWVSSGTALTYRACGKNGMLCQFLGPGLRDWKLPLPFSWNARSGDTRSHVRHPTTWVHHVVRKPKLARGEAA